MAISCIFYSTNIKELRLLAINFSDMLALYCVIHSFVGNKEQIKEIDMDILNLFKINQTVFNVDFKIVIDSLFLVLSNDDTDCWLISKRIINLIIDTSMSISKEIQDPNKSCLELKNLELVSYLTEKLCNLCYERSWFSKRAG